MTNDKGTKVRQIQRFCVVLHMMLTIFLGACSMYPQDKSHSSLVACSSLTNTTNRETSRGSWRQSFRAACRDSKGQVAGGSEILHLVPHRGSLFAANGFWMDKSHYWYGGNDPSKPWGQVLRLDASEQGWQVDAVFANHLRIESLASVSFSTDYKGRSLNSTQSVLLAAAYEGNGEGGINLFERDDVHKRWLSTRIVKDSLGAKGIANSVRVIKQYRDKLTGIDRVFVAAGIHGIWSGAFANDQERRIVWTTEAEFGPLPVRALSLAEANNSLFVSVGSMIYRRVDGHTPHYERIAEIGDSKPSDVMASVGGIRGMAAVPSPDGRAESLLFLWTPGKHARACMMRMDPEPNDSIRYQLPVIEVCLDEMIETHLRGIPVRFVLGAYNEIFSLRRAERYESIELFGVEAIVADRDAPTAMNQPMGEGGFYAGAIVVARKGTGNYRLTEVNCFPLQSESPLVALRTIAASPFDALQGGELYFGGYDANFHLGQDTAWIFRSSSELFYRLFEEQSSPC